MQNKYNEIYNNDQYLTANPNWHAEDSPWKAEQIRKIVESNGVDFLDVVEVGSGAGEILINLSKYYPDSHFEGYDISKQAHDLAMQKQSDKVEFILGDVPADRKTADCLLCIDVFEHIENYIEFLKQKNSAAKYKIFHIPLDINVVNVARASPIQHARDSVGHLHYFTKETALETLKYCGYEIVDSSYTLAFLDLPSRTWKGWLMKWPRRLLYNISKDMCVRLIGGCALIVLTK